MSARQKLSLTIVFLVSVMSFSALGFGWFFAEEYVLQTLGKDMALLCEVVDRLISCRADLFLEQLDRVSKALDAVQEVDISAVLREKGRQQPCWLAMSYVGRDGRERCSDPPDSASGGYFGSRTVQLALWGQKAFSTLEKDASGRLVFRIAVPARDGALVATLPAEVFSDLISRLTVWDTGHIFIVDNSGTLIASSRPKAMENQRNFFIMARTRPEWKAAAELFSKMVQGARGVGRYKYLDGVDRLFAYAPLGNLMGGWSVGVYSSLVVGPLLLIRRGFLTAAVLLVVFGLPLELSVARLIGRAFEQIRRQNIHLAELREAAENASSAKTDFLSNMSHEMRTPLNAIIGLSELAIGSETTASEKDSSLQKIYRSGQVLLGIVNDILDISKVASGRFELNPITYDIPSLINDCVMLNVMRISSKPIRFTLDLDRRMPLNLFGDELRVRQIFSNLLSNAFKYTERGSVKWSLSCERDGKDVWMTGSVTDTGIGIRPEDIDRIFLNYTQLDTKRNRKIEGTGLGLSIAKHLVEMMGGSITLKSEYGKGTTFTVRLRQQFVSDTIIDENIINSLMSFDYFDTRRTRNSNLKRRRLPHIRVLVVDDVETNLDVARGMLKPYGVQTDCLTSGRQAIEAIRSGEVHYDVIFMDHMMPVMDGIETVRRIRALKTEYAASIPIIALTANAILGNEQMFLSNGFQAFLSKPIDVMCLDRIIRRWAPQKPEELASLSEKPEAESSEEEPPENEKGDGPGLFSGWKIEGLDIEKGLVRFGGDEEICLDVFRAWVTTTPLLLEQLRDYNAWNDPTRDREKDWGKLEAYTIAVHGLKGSCYSMEAIPLGKQAEALERAGKTGDLEFIRRHNSEFLAAVEKLVKELTLKIEETDRLRQKPKKDRPDKALLTELLEACERFSMDGVDGLVSQLERAEYESGSDLVLWLRRQADMAAFGEMRERLVQELQTWKMEERGGGETPENDRNKN
ncbi:MAG: response regulator [Synergistaceae bacterium]|nr:response regulator [Synergistaceae bacterium]